MIRKSSSAPARLSLAKLDICLVKVNQLASRVDRITSEALRSRSISDFRELAASKFCKSGPSHIMGDDEVGEK